MADKEAMEVLKEDVSPSTSSAFAENECAMALLDLASSFSPPNGMMRPKVEDMFSPDSLFSISSALYLNGASDKNVKGKSLKATGSGKTSILKRQLEHSERRGVPSKSLENYDPNIAVKLECPTAEDLRCELVKRIKLDHNYPCAGDFSWNRYVKAISHPSGDAPTRPQGKAADGKNRKEHGPSQSSSGYGNARSKRSPNEQKGNSNKYQNQPSQSGRKSNANYAKVESNPSFWQQKDRKHVRPEVKSESEAQKQGFCPDLYQPNDSKYKNFNLLLKCLKTDDTCEDKVSVKAESDSFRSSSTVDGSDDEMQLHIADSYPDSSEYQCMCCSRVFQQKRYLTKHMRRMHPEVLGGEKRKDDNVACPSCGQLVMRKNFKQHSNVCNMHTKKSKKQLEMDLANCQFCGIRMRRHILVRHLAQEHCVENIRESGMYMMETSDSSTLSGSEHGEDDPSDDGDEDEASGQYVNSYKDSTSQSTNPASDGMSHQQSGSKEGFDHAQEDKAEPKTFPDPGTYIDCQLCGDRISENLLPEHFKSAHGIEETKPIPDPSKGAARQVCMHSMLQRFLSEHSDEGSLARGSSETSSEACDSCVQRLVSHTHDDDGYVSSNNNNNNNYTSRPSPPLPAVSITKAPTQAGTSTNATYTIFIPKDNPGYHGNLSGAESKV